MSQEETTEDFASLFAEYEKQEQKPKRREVRVGDSVAGKVVSIGRDGAFGDLGLGSLQALLALDDVRDAKGNVNVQVGDDIKARVVETSGKAGCIVLRRSMAKGAVGSAELAQAAQFGLAVEGLVTAVNKGGVDVLVAGVRGFCPISQLDLRHVEDATPYVGQKFPFKITKYEGDNRGINIVVSRRAVLEEARKAEAMITRGKLVPGAVMNGVVSSLRDFGAFIDLGGIDGLLPASEISFQRGLKPSDTLAVGQEIEVQILRVEKTEDPKRPERISLSLKSLTRDPWQDLADKLVPGSKVQGKVARAESFGAFIELEPGIEGLAHISELSGGKQAKHARELVKPGDVIEVTVLSVDREKRRISLGTGEREEVVDAEDFAAARRAAPERLGTFGDLFKNLKV